MWIIVAVAEYVLPFAEVMYVLLTAGDEDAKLPLFESSDHASPSCGKIADGSEQPALQGLPAMLNVRFVSVTVAFSPRYCPPVWGVSAIDVPCPPALLHPRL